MQFQSTLPRGERRLQRNIHRIHHNISIHAPARGATDLENRIAGHIKFQSTLPRGERRSKGREPRCLGYFNPRSREGSDALKAAGFEVLTISIHAPARGATQVDQRSRCRITISIHAPARGATSIFAKKFSSLLAKIV